jgi:perosamine synthetase
MLRYDSAAWDGLPRERFLEALNAEGVPATAGYSFPSFDNPIFQRLDLKSSRSVYMCGRTSSIDYGDFARKCPNAIRACREEAIWLMHHLFLGDKSDVDTLVEAILKIKQHCHELG